jgi:hypothetical protein
VGLFRVFRNNRYHSPDYVYTQTNRTVCKKSKKIEALLIIKFSESLVDTVNIFSVISLEWE